MNDTMGTTKAAAVLGPGPSRGGSLPDILIYIAAALGFYGIEEVLCALWSEMPRTALTIVLVPKRGSV